MRYAIACLMLTLATPLHAQTPAATDNTVVISATGGAFGRGLQDFFYTPFEKATGIKVVRVDTELPEQFARLRAGVAANNVEYDIITMGPSDVAEKRDLLASIDCNALPNLKTDGIPGACTGYGIVRTLGGMTVTYNATEFKGRQPATWADLWDTKTFPGPRALPDTGDREWWLPVAALLADGVTPDKLWPLDLDRAYRKLDQIRPDVAVWYKSNDQGQQAFRSGEAVIGMMVSGRAVALAKEGQPVKFSWTNSIRDVGMWGLARNAPHPKAAMAFLNYFLGNPEAHLKFADIVNYDTGNRSSVELLPQDQRPLRISFPANLASQIMPDYDWIAANRPMLRDRFTTWLAR